MVFDYVKFVEKQIYEKLPGMAKNRAEHRYFVIDLHNNSWFFVRHGDTLKAPMSVGQVVDALNRRSSK